MAMDKKRIGIVLGDVAGVGPEIVVKVIDKNRNDIKNNLVIVGDYDLFESIIIKSNVDLEIRVIEDKDEILNSDEKILFYDLKTLHNQDYRIGEPSAVCGKAVITELMEVIDLARNNVVSGLFYAPLNKYSMNKAGFNHFSEKGLFEEFLKSSDNAYEINILNNIWTNRVTSHIPFRDIARTLSKDNIFNAISALNGILKDTFKNGYKIYVAGLNPHAGESGTLGSEENGVIIPAIMKAQDDGMDVEGPFSADTIFVKAKKEEICGVVTMYHDQGQIAMKLMGFENGVTYQAGFSIPIVTPAHGTAFDIAGKGCANENSAATALKCLCAMVPQECSVAIPNAHV